MQRCPRCGYREKDWPSILIDVAFGTLWCVFMMTSGHTLMNLIVGLAAFCTFVAAGTWRGLRDKRNGREYLRGQSK